ncbi:hypothetical protein LIER_39642 [Lithospermum erythrorhizon]|uniref:Retrotransposon gag domain-containing protein n=1 Tax=Lithospermum erythrorhizon TaxID=34254 RepID=A0AAV3QL13_LITER
MEEITGSGQKSVQLVICGRGKWGYITGSICKPSEDESRFLVWEAENSIVMAWLINSMESDIRRQYLNSTSAKDIWDGVKTMFSDMGNTSQLYELKNRVRDLRQNNLFVTAYFSSLKNLWEELDLYLEHDQICSACNIKFVKRKEKDRVFG